jgi:hypothetical protein
MTRILGSLVSQTFASWNQVAGLRLLEGLRSGMTSTSGGPRFRTVPRGEDGAVDRPYFVRGQRPDQPFKPFPWHRRQLVDHQSARPPQSALSGRLNGKSEDWRRHRTGGQGAHDDRVVGVESVVLNDDGWPGFSRIGRAARDGADLVARLQAGVRQCGAAPGFRPSRAGPATRWRSVCADGPS